MNYMFKRNDYHFFGSEQTITGKDLCCGLDANHTGTIDYVSDEVFQ